MAKDKAKINKNLYDILCLIFSLKKEVNKYLKRKK